MTMVALPLESGLAIGAEEKIGLNFLAAIRTGLLFLNVLKHGFFGKLALVHIGEGLARADQKIENQPRQVKNDDERNREDLEKQVA